ncbi:MAG: prolipoprotein diacylglyceryl transferase [Lachnospiraceae bacterium]|nr:prolipoprotein diacylglyceryl transferase [Lachnospiraceae bacterium]
MHKDLFSIGPVTVHGYGLFIAIGVVVALLVAMYRAKRRGLDSDLVFNITLLVAVTGILGAKLLYIIMNWSEFIKDPVSGLTEGFVVYGGIILGIAAGFIYLKFKKAVFSDYFDIIMPGVAIAQGFGRIGCFMAGCCYGIPCDGPFCVKFPADSLAPSGVNLFPSQLVSALGNFLIAAILIYASRKMKYSGHTGALYVALYAAGRFVIEFFRSDERGHIGPLTTSQFISILMMTAAIVLFIYYYRKKIPAAALIVDKKDEAGVGSGDGTEDKAEEKAEDGADEGSEEQSGDKPEDTPVEEPEEASEEVSGEVSEDGSEGASKEAFEDRPEELPEDDQGE